MFRLSLEWLWSKDKESRLANSPIILTGNRMESLITSGLKTLLKPLTIIKKDKTETMVALIRAASISNLAKPKVYLLVLLFSLKINAIRENNCERESWKL
jgi:hypothetical protein